MYVTFPKLERPKGAMATVEEVQAAIGSGLFSVCGVSPSVRFIDLSMPCVITQGNEQGSLALFEQKELNLRGGEAFCKFFLTDNNIGAAYNYNFLFAKGEDAMAFARFLNNDPAWQVACAEHNAECRQWDDIFDGYYDED